MLKLNSKRDIIQMVGNMLYFFFILVLMLDPTNSVLHLKEFLMVLLVGYNAVFFKPVFDYVPQLVAVIAAVAISYIFAEMQGNVVNYEFVAGTLKSFAVLVLLLWMPYYDLLQIAKVAGLVMGILISVVYIAVCADPLIEGAVFLYASLHDGMIKMARRSFLGFQVFGFYYTSIIALILITYAYIHALFLKKRRRVLNLIAVIFLIMSFVASGSRSTMLLPFALLGFAWYLRVRNTKHIKYFIYPLISLLIVFFVSFIMLLASESDESSNVAKYGHLVSYSQLFFEHPEYLVFGQGVGTSFYSIGFHQMTLITEWTYIEILRHYGVFAVLVLFLVLYPLKALYLYRKDEMTCGIFFAYIVYLFIVGTNPLFISSTGMVVILIIYNYIYRLENKQRQPGGV